MQTSGLFLERTVLETLSWFSHFKWATVLEKLAEREIAVSSGGCCTPKHLESQGFVSVVRPFLGTERGPRGAPTWWPCWDLCSRGVIRIQPRQPSPTASFSYMCSHYPAVCCCNAPINFPFDILRAIYKSCRLSFVPSLMLGNNAAVLSSSG